MTPPESRHPVYPGGPDCNPHCPGEHSMYHDGYADGYENALAAPPPPAAPLDVERLARAIEIAFLGNLTNDGYYDREDAAAIAAEYARLAQPEPPAAGGTEP